VFSDAQFSVSFQHADPWRCFRLVYGVQLGDALWVVHAFQKKSTRGIRTPKHEIDLIVDRIKRLKQMLKES
jgi:phage-related protein